MNMKEYLGRNWLMLGFPFLVLVLVFTFLIATNRTILPLDIFDLADFRYEQGNAKQIKNSYTVDLVGQYLPWKYYLIEGQPKPCDWPHAKNRRIIDGIELPQGDCYPLEAVRANIYFDSIYIFSKFSTFFTAYNLSYLALLLFFLAIAIGSFREFFRSNSGSDLERNFLPILLGVAFVGSFPVARELQYDGPVAGIPFLLLASALGYRELQKDRNWILLFAVGIFLSLAMVKATLQSLALYPIIFSLVLGMIWIQTERSIKTLGPYFLVMILSLIPAIFHYRDSIELFLQGTAVFLPDKDLSSLRIVFNRALAVFFAMVNFFTGDLFFSFDTIDFSKIVGELGTRERYSYDGVSFFSHFFVAILALVVFKGVKTNNKLKKQSLLFLSFVLLIVFSPLHKIVYFRALQWSALFFVFVLIALNGKNINWERFRRVSFILLGIIGGACLVAGVLSNLTEETILAQLEGANRGLLSFESGFWCYRFSEWQERVFGMDIYVWVFFVSSISIVVLTKQIHQAGARFAVLMILTISTLLLNTFHYNPPHKTDGFSSVLESIERNPRDKRVKQIFYFPENINLLVGQPARRIDESLAIH